MHAPSRFMNFGVDPATAGYQLFLYQFLTGVLYGYLWYRYRNLPALIIAHGAYDLASGLMGTG